MIILLGSEDLSSLPVMEQETIRLLQKHRELCLQRLARARKFGTTYVTPQLQDSLPYSELRRMRANPSDSALLNGSSMDLHSPEEQAKLERRKSRFGTASNSGDDALKTPSEATMVPSEQAWDKIDLVGEQRVDPPPELWLDPPVETNPIQDEFEMKVEPRQLEPRKLHLFSIDWAAFKQIRTSDLEKYFDGYGATYVEWLGDLSCNIHFTDTGAASRALDRLSQELPRDKTPDLGRMGWRLGKSMVQKVANDRHGRKGTRARVLLRVATTKDILEERPSSWKTPPGEFSTEKVLGPESDVPAPKPKGKKKGRKRKQQHQSTRTTEELLSGGLSAGRAGYSAEDLDAERATKREKVY